MPFIRRLIATTVAASLTLSTLPLYAQPSAQGDSGLIRTEQVAAAAVPAWRFEAQPRPWLRPWLRGAARNP